MAIENTDKILAAKEKIEAGLSELCGRPWKEAWCNIHAQNNKIVFFVLLYEDIEVKTAHSLFCDVFAPYVDAIQPFHAVVMYYKFTENGLFSIESLDGSGEAGNDAIFSALESDTLGTFLMECEDSIFESTDSKRENA